MTHKADLVEEYRLQAQGFVHLAGLDEAGRGAWAGPVVAGAVILPLDRFDLAHALDGVNDSKQLSAQTRETLFSHITDTALAVGIGHASNDEIDQLGIVPATRLAMVRALDQLAEQPDLLLIDSMQLSYRDLPCTSLVKGDQKSLSIAAASIIAKVTRDQHMALLDNTFPQYGFLVHKGYGTDLHHQALKQFGPTSVHRKTFAPVQALVDSGKKEAGL
ncbi:MAG: ribonuclease HII [Anaerolineae bacterium]|nr:ribonuclease HII [Anaerolineae bacterium]